MQRAVVEKCVVSGADDDAPLVRARFITPACVDVRSFPVRTNHAAQHVQVWARVH
jgi:hypothetical protein